MALTRLTMNFINVVILFLFYATFLTTSFDAVGQQPVIAQYPDSTDLFKVDLMDGTSIVGSIISKDSVWLIMSTSSLPRIEIPMARVKSLEEIDKSSVRYGVYWFKNPHPTRYLFSPSAFNLPRGEGYYQNTMLTLNSVNYGVTNHFSIGGGIEMISTFISIAPESDGDVKPIVFITPKVGFKVVGKLHAGAGVIYATTPSTAKSDAINGLGLGYAITTFGTIDHHITGGVGLAYADDDFVKKPVFTVSGTTRLSRRTAFVSENWFVHDNKYHAFYSYGIRFFGERIAVDVAFVNNRDIYEAIFIGIPYVDFVLKF